jgi:undecaprenyl-diphosphatase
MTFLQVIILGIVEGITEFLPISSTAHLEFITRLIGIVQTDFIKSFLVVIQFGAILAVVVIYFKKIFASRGVFLRMVVGFIPTGVIGFLLYKLIKNFLIGNEWVAIITLIAGGIIILLVERKSLVNPSTDSLNAISIEQLPYVDMVKLGLIQSLAVIPGVSRSGSIIIGGKLLGISRELIIDAAFLLAIPTMAAAAGYDLLKSGLSFSGREWVLLLVGSLVSFITALFAIRWLLHYIRKASFRSFGWYRIIAGIIFAILFLFIK